MGNFKMAFAILFVMIGILLIWAAISWTGVTILNLLANAGLDWIFGAIIIATFVWLYIRIVAALWK